MHPVRTAALILCCFLFLAPDARATHSAGAELLYEWVGDSTYRIVYKFYRDCGGRGIDDTLVVCFENECNFYRSSEWLTIASGPRELFPGCPGYKTKCEDPTSTLPGYQEYIYEAFVTLPYRCDKWRFWVNNVARNTGIGNLVNMPGYLPPNYSMFVEATLNNRDVQGNSSPVFSIPPVPYVCIHKPHTYNSGAVDIDNDELVYSLINPREIDGSLTNRICNYGKAHNIQICCGYDLEKNPFSTSNTFDLDTVYGDIRFTPNQLQKVVIAQKVKEYRNGVEIGSVMRDIQINIIPCNYPEIIPRLDTAGIQGALVAGKRVEGCVETPMEVCIDFRAPGFPDAKIYLSDNRELVIPAASISYVNTGTDSVRACFSWTPQLQDTGNYTVVFIMKDSSCTAPGILAPNTFSLHLYVNPYTRAWSDSTICEGDSMQLHVSGWNDFIWDVLPGGDAAASIGCRSCTSTWVKPAVSTQYIVNSVHGICRRNADTVSVTVLPSPDFTLTHDSTICISHDLLLEADINKLPGLSYEVRWSPATGLAQTSGERTRAAPQNDITYYVTVKESDKGCTSVDSVRITVLPGFLLHNPDTAICLGSSVQVRLTGDDRYSYRWDPATSVSDPGIRQPLITPAVPGTYRVTASYPGCRDSAAAFRIDVQEYPGVMLPGDTLICKYDSLTVQASVGPAGGGRYTYTWTASDPGALLIPGALDTERTFLSAADAEVRLTVATSAGCTGEDIMRIGIAGLIRVSGDTAICPGDTAQLRVEGRVQFVEWEPAHWLNDPRSTGPLAFPPGTTTFTVRGADTLGCSDTQTVYVVVHPLPVLSLPDTIVVYEGAPEQVNPGGNGVSFEWRPPSEFSDPYGTNPYALYPDVQGWRHVHVRTEEGCPINDSFYVRPDMAVIVMPNAFTPELGTNRLLRPVYRGGVWLRYFKVFNRWGEIVFETKDINEGWDGRRKGAAQPVGVYVYIVEAVLPGGQVVMQQGNITLIR